MNTPNTHKHIRRNTKKCRMDKPLRARSWCFTWNNHTSENWHTCTSLFEQMKIKKMVCQEEKEKNETKHIQGFIMFENAINFSTLKKIDGKIHWEVCRNIPASINYCSKKETRDGQSYKYGMGETQEYIKEIDAVQIQFIYDDMKRQMLETLGANYTEDQENN